MSKSLGNVIAPEEVIKQFGAEVIRLWVSSVEFNEDVRLSPVILERLAEAYRKIRNTFRYALGNLDAFDPDVDAVETHDLEELDQWILWKAGDLVEKCRAHYEEFAFHRVYQAFYNFCTVDLSSIYFDILKDRLYTSATKSHARRSAQTALYRLTHALTRLIAPILAFTAEETWAFFPKKQGDPDSIHLAHFPTPEEVTVGLSLDQKNRLANWDRILGVRESVLKSLESARQEKFIGAPLEAKVVLDVEPELYALLQEYVGALPGVFITSQVELREGAVGGVAVRVEKAEGTKCERCWKYKTDIGTEAEYPTACASCASAVKEMLGA
jgi:isoleucyl-tRNA synthetase